jgi:DNA-binding transcriptional MerR regulator
MIAKATQRHQAEDMLGNGSRGVDRAAVSRDLEFSSQQVADLVGVTRRTLRHYHAIGLLPESNRTCGGYHTYGAEHVLRLLRIKRLTMRGLSLEEIADVLSDSGNLRSERVLAELDRALADQMAEIRSRRRILAEMRQTQSPVDTLPEFAGRLEAWRRLGRLDAAEAQRLLTEMVTSFDSEVSSAFEARVDEIMADPEAERLAELENRLADLDENASEQAVNDLALDYGQALVELYDDFSGGRMNAIWATPQAPERLVQALAPESLSPKQYDVLRRATTVLAAHLRR